MTYRLQTLILALLLACAGAVLAAGMSLDDAKQQGLVGEQPDGYLGAVTSNASAEVAGLIQDINSRRRAEYQRIAGANDISVADVEKLAGQKAIGRTAPGNYIRDAQGNWRRK